MLSFRILALFLVGKGDFCSSDYLIVVCLFVFPLAAFYQNQN